MNDLGLSISLSVGLWFVGQIQAVQATDIASPATVTDPSDPEIVFSAGGSHSWRIKGNEVAGFRIEDWIGNTPVVIDPPMFLNDYGTQRLRIDAYGSIGMGTTTPNLIGSEFLNGRMVNIRADHNTPPPHAEPDSGVAGFVAQGRLGAQLHLAHLTAPANRRVLRMQVSSGFLTVSTLSDDLRSYSLPNALTINMATGNVGLRVANPVHPLQLASGARCTIGGVWTNASSRELKEDIRPVTNQQARAVIRGLQPVDFRYKSEPQERYVGFISEDVPEMVATADRKSLAAMDMVAILTTVVQDQDRLLEEQREAGNKQEMELKRLESVITRLEKRFAALEQTMGTPVEIEAEPVE